MKKFVSLLLALVICLTALALPYFPIGCGATQKTAPAPEAAPEAAPAPERAPEAAPVPEAAPAPEAAPEAEENPLEDATEAITVWFNDTAYELLPGVTSVPEDLGEQLGEVTSSDGRDLTGCSVFAAVESEDIYVEVPEGYLRGMKTE